MRKQRKSDPDPESESMSHRHCTEYSSPDHPPAPGTAEIPAGPHGPEPPHSDVNRLHQRRFHPRHRGPLTGKRKPDPQDRPPQTPCQTGNPHGKQSQGNVRRAGDHFEKLKTL